ncbi:NAD-dependent epimerase/dehydratase family protein [Bacillus salacetis]|uniref:NAD-dependent epimerase/dehydratase family protein n=1 Tax=Bacillus salacetis TaxID=2315464 RepID=A0A3A1QYY9_9BACI|nr:SDR family oxidoreductase [Bacillus salacetis]RIW30905.1 NAD-dependent epimerase/dehydratase family protein [Bacillus salacetis]
MNIALLGASGRTGQLILDNALKDGHYVRALSRNVSAINDDHPNLSIIEGDVLNEEDIELCFHNCDAVISALGTDKNDVLSKSAPLILQTMRKHRIDRIITIGTAGILQSRVNPSLYRFQTSESKRKSSTAAEDHLRTYLMLKNSKMNWTIVCPTYLPEGKRTGVFRTEKEVLPEGGISISVSDTADFAYSLISDNESYYCRIGISY